MQKDDVIYRQAAIDEIEYELEMINSALDSITFDFNARERLRQRRGEAREILNSIQQLPSAEQDVAEKLHQCKCYITDKKGLQHEVIHIDDIRRVTGWTI